MKAIVVTDQAAGTAGMTLVERPEPPAAINDVVVQIHASGFVPTELAWPSTWTDRLGRDRTPSIPLVHTVFGSPNCWAGRFYGSRVFTKPVLRAGTGTWVWMRGVTAGGGSGRRLLEPSTAASLVETHLAKPWRTCQ